MYIRVSYSFSILNMYLKTHFSPYLCLDKSNYAPVCKFYENTETETETAVLTLQKTETETEMKF